MGKPLPDLELAAPEPKEVAPSRVHHRMRRGPDRRRKPAVEGMHGWRPGMPGLIAGKKGYVNWSARIKNYLSEHPEMAATILERWILDAANGVPGARESLIDRVDGKVLALPGAGMPGKVELIFRFEGEAAPELAGPVVEGEARELIGDGNSDNG